MNFTNMNISIKGNVLYQAGYQRKLQYYDLNVKGAKETYQNKLNVAEFWWKIELKRRLRPILIQIFIPTSLLVMVSWASFVIPADSFPGRFGLLVGLVLCLINILLNVLSNSPNIEGVNLLAAWMVLCIVMVVIAFVEYSIILFCMRYKKRRQATQQIQTEEHKVESKASNQEQKPILTKFSRSMDTYALTLTPIIFAIVIGVYLGLWLQNL